MELRLSMVRLSRCMLRMKEDSDFSRWAVLALQLLSLVTNKIPTIAALRYPWSSYLLLTASWSPTFSWSFPVPSCGPQTSSWFLGCTVLEISASSPRYPWGCEICWPGIHFIVFSFGAEGGGRWWVCCRSWLDVSAAERWIAVDRGCRQ